MTLKHLNTRQKLYCLHKKEEEGVKGERGEGERGRGGGGRGGERERGRGLGLGFGRSLTVHQTLIMQTACTLYLLLCKLQFLQN